MKKFFMPVMAAFIYILLFSLHIHASEAAAPAADGSMKQISENTVTQEGDSESDLEDSETLPQETASETGQEATETVPPPNNTMLFQENGTEPMDTETSESTNDLEEKFLCSYDPNENFDSVAAYTLKYGEDTSELIDGIKSITLYIGWTEPFNVYQSIPLHAEWSVYTGTAQEDGISLTQESLDSTVPGTYQVKGTLLLPQGFQWKEGFIPPVPVISIQILENGEKQQLTRLDNSVFSYSLHAELYEVNSSLYSYSLENAPKNVPAFTGDYSSSAILTASWDYSAVDISRPGNYTVHVRLTLPEEYQLDYSLDPSLESHSKTIYVRTPGTLCMYVEYIDTRFAGNWLEPLDEAYILPYYMTSEKELTDTELKNTCFNPCTDRNLFDFSYSHFCVYRDALDPDTHYYFKISYKGQESNILHIHDNGEEASVSYVEGNRDGGDGGQHAEPPITQPAPDMPDIPAAQESAPVSASASTAEPETEVGFTAQDMLETSESLPEEMESSECHLTDATTPSEQPGLENTKPAESPSGPGMESESSSENASRQDILETVTQDSTTISAARLKILSGSYPDFIPFEHNGILLRLPVSWLEEQIHDDDTLFTVTLLRLSEETFRILLSVDGNELTELPASSVMLPIEDTVPSYRLMHETGCVKEGLVAKDGFLSLTITKTGEYRLEKEDILGLEKPEAQPYGADIFRLLFIAVTGLILIAAGIYLIYRKRGS
ncbi:hypothetical protein [Eisenbergiella sp.]